MKTIAESPNVALRWGCLALFAGLLVVYCSVRAPKYNWDVIGYVAAGYSYLGLEGWELHEATFSDIRAAAGEERLQELIEGDRFRYTVGRDSAALEQQGQYRTRVGYVSSALLLSYFIGGDGEGRNISLATYLISLGAAVITLLMLGSLLVRVKLAAFLLFPVFLSMAGLSSMARYSSPDMLAAMATLAVVCIGLKRPRWAIFLLPLLPLFRIDYILLVPLFAWVLYSRAYRVETAVALVSVAAVYLLIDGLLGAGALNHLEMFSYGFIQGPQPYTADITVSTDIRHYISAYLNGIEHFVTEVKNWPIFIGTVLALRDGISGRRSFAGFTLAAAAFTLLHFMFWPTGHYRFAFVATALSLIIIFQTAGRPTLFIGEKIRRWLDGADPFCKLWGLKGDIYREKEGRRTFRCEIDGKPYFIKLHSGVGWREIVKNLLQLRLPVVGSYNEWRGINRMQQLGIGTMRAAAYGRRGLNPARRDSFIVTEELQDAVSLEDYCRDWAAAPPPFKLKQVLLERVAAISAAMHRGGMCHRDYYLCHLLLHEQSGREGGCDGVGIGRSMPVPRLSVIDLHRSLCRFWLRPRWVVKDLGGLYYSAMDIGLTHRDLLRFIRCYEGRDLRKCLRRRAGFWRKVQRRGRSLHQRLHPPRTVPTPRPLA